MKRNFFDTEFAIHAGLKSQMPRVLKYTIEHRNSILQYDEFFQLASSIRRILQSPLAQYFERVIASEGLRYFAAMNITEKGGSIPELLTTNSISLDTKQAADDGKQMPLPEINEKVLLNISGCLKPNRLEGGFEVNVVDLFQQMVVRGHLVMSYFDATKQWLNPSLAEFTIRSYSMILSNMIARYYDLSLLEQMTVAGIFALYYSYLLSPKDCDPTRPPLFYRCTFIGNRNDQENILSISEEEARKGLTLSAVARLIAANLPERMNKFSVNELNILCGNLGPDTISSMTALEYPPVWVYFLLLTVSGTKIPLVFQLNNQKLMQQCRSTFLHQLLTDDSVFDMARR